MIVSPQAGNTVSRSRVDGSDPEKKFALLRTKASICCALPSDDDPEISVDGRNWLFGYFRPAESGLKSQFG